MKNVSSCLAGALLLAAASTALGQVPTINGNKDAIYGAPLWVNTANPTGFGDNVPGTFPCSSFGSGMRLAINNSNIAGVGGAAACVAGAGAPVTTGVEIQIPFSAINNPSEATIKIAGFVIGQGHDFISNQVIGSPPAPTCLPANLGEPRLVTFNDADVGGVAGNQFVSVLNGTATDPTGPVIDGTLDAAFYGAALWVNDTDTAFGDSNLGLPGSSNGSEIDAVYARVVEIAGQKQLFIFVSGNVESNFNKIWVFLDTATGQGQNQLLNNNPNLDFNGLNRLGRTNNLATDGLKFDASFTADYGITCTNGGSPTVTTFANIGEILTAGDGQGRFVGSAVNPAPIIVTPCVSEPLPVPSPDKAYGSEIDAIYGIVCENFLHVFIAGNLEVNNNKLDMFFDVDNTTLDAGQQTLRADNVAVDFGGLNRMGAGNEGPGLTFDPTFKADYWLSVHNDGFATLDPVSQAAEASFLRTNGAAGDVTNAQGLLDFGSFTRGLKSVSNPLSFDGTFCVREVAMVCMPNGAGSSSNPSSVPGIDVQGDLNTVVNALPPIAEPFASFAPRLISANSFDPLGTVSPNPNLTFPGLITVSIDNSNILGVTGSTATDGQLVNTGIEFKIRLDELGWDGVSPIRLTAFINGSGHDFLSNQVSGGLPAGTVNPGEARLVNFDETTGGFVGSQFVTIPTGPCIVVPLTGACCCGSSCTITTVAACPTGPGTNRTFAGLGTTCLPFSNQVPCCRGDYNKSGSSVSVQDIFDFLTGYFSGDSCANTNDSMGAVSVQDIFDFLSAYFSGC